MFNQDFYFFLATLLMGAVVAVSIEVVLIRVRIGWYGNDRPIVQRAIAILVLVSIAGFALAKADPGTARKIFAPQTSIEAPIGPLSF